jgi:hypothetical protein
MLGQFPASVRPTLCLLEKSGIGRCPALRNQDPQRGENSGLDAWHPESERIWQRRRMCLVLLVLGTRSRTVGHPVGAAALLVLLARGVGRRRRTKSERPG